MSHNPASILSCALLAMPLIFGTRASAIEVVASYTSPGIAAHVEAVGTTAYLVDKNALRILDVADPSAPVVLSNTLPPGFGSFWQVDVAGNLAYLAQGQGGLTIFDVSNPTLPVLIGQLDPHPTGTLAAKWIAVEGTTVYLGSDALVDRVDVIDASDPALPFVVGSFEPGILYGALEAEGTLLHVGSAETEIWDVSIPAVPVFLGSYAGELSRSVLLDGDHAYVAGAAADVSNPTAPLVTGTLPEDLSDVTAQGNTLHVLRHDPVSGASGFTVYDRSDPAVPVIGLRNQPVCNPHPFLGLDIELAGDGTLYCAAIGEGVRRFGYVGWHAPIVLDELPGETEARDVEVLGGRVHLAVGADGIRIYDPQLQTLLGSFDPGFGVVEDLEVFGGVAYLASGFGGLQTIDVSDPAAMSLLGSAAAGGSQRAIAIAGERAYTVSDTLPKLHIFDISDPSAPTLVSDLVLGAQANEIVVVDDIVYVGSNSQIEVIDVSTETSPQVIATSGVAGRGFVVQGDRLFRSGAQLRILDVSNPAAPTLLASSVAGFGVSFDVVARGHILNLDNGVLDVQDDVPTSLEELAHLDLAAPAGALTLSNGLVIATQEPAGIVFIDPILLPPPWPFGPCNDDVDNDADGAIDHPADPDCWGLRDLSEEPDCSDGVDNDGDGLVDAGRDPGCPNPFAQRESPQCQNGWDDDGDGAIDGADSLCTQPWKRESPKTCGLGFELALVLLVIAPLRRRRRGVAW